MWDTKWDSLMNASPLIQRHFRPNTAPSSLILFRGWPRIRTTILFCYKICRILWNRASHSAFLHLVRLMNCVQLLPTDSPLTGVSFYSLQLQVKTFVILKTELKTTRLLLLAPSSLGIATNWSNFCYLLLQFYLIQLRHWSINSFHLRGNDSRIIFARIQQ